MLIYQTYRFKNSHHTKLKKLFPQNHNGKFQWLHVPKSNIQGCYSNHYGMNNQYWSGFIKKKIDKPDNFLQEAYL